MKAVAVAFAAALLLGALALVAELGRPAANETVQRITIEDLRFRPNRIDVKAGETLTLEVVNRGSQRHDLNFHSLHMPNLGGLQVILDPGEARTIQLRIDTPGTHTFSCSHPGHMAAGMSGAVFVSP